ncbi:hypothetical protein EBZ38_11465 [bacterium]|nr:hypothetical protein [bacterium]NDC95100.1 hypothetical protein [bacterium]NDD84870.1 hypothetical protein [bacterium]
MPVQTKVQLRRGSSTQWALSTDPLSMGEIGYDTTLKKFKIGDGSTLWSSLDWATTLPSELNEIIDDRVNDLIIAGNGIVKTYDDANNTLNISSPLSAGSGISLSHSNGTYTITNTGIVTNAGDIAGFDTQVRTNRLDQMAAPTSSVSFNNQKITSLATPTADSDAANKAYVDAIRSGLDVKQSVRVATTGNITLSGVQTIDGVSVVAGDRVLVKDQNSYAQNGIYDVAVGNWSRSSDSDSANEVTAGMFTFVEEGSANADSGWVLTTNNPISLDTTGLVFTQFSGAGQITAGAGLTKNGNTIDIGTASSSRIIINSDSIDLATISRSDSTGSSSSSFIQSVTSDSYGRITGVTSGLISDASTSSKGIASFDSGDFNVTSGAVSIKSGGVDNNQLANSSVTIGSSSVSLGGSLTTINGLTTISGTSANSPTTLNYCVIDGGTP